MTRYLFLASLLFLAPLLSTAQLEEKRPCIAFDSPQAVASKDEPGTTSECKTNQCSGGCCRFHTAFLTCDKDNDFPHQACICNGITAEPKETAPTGNVAVTPVATPVVAPSRAPVPPSVATPVVAPSRAPVTTPTSVITSPIAGTTQAASCANGSVWQTLGRSYENCAIGSDCAGILENGKQTCCKRAFCWCGKFDVAAAECVA
jgi:hypothetical protein